MNKEDVLANASIRNACKYVSNVPTVVKEFFIDKVSKSSNRTFMNGI